MAPALRSRCDTAFPRRLAVPWSEELVDDLWRLTLGNLQAYLRGGDGIVLPDYTDPNPEIPTVDRRRQRAARPRLPRAPWNPRP